MLKFSLSKMKPVFTTLIFTLCAFCGCAASGESRDDALLKKASSFANSGKDAEAVKIWEQLVDKGNAHALCSLGRSYLGGAGVMKDESLGLALITKAAEKKFAACSLFLADFYASGRFEHLGLKKDQARAFSMYKSLANDGYQDSFSSLALAYETGEGTDINYSEALTWYTKAADTGDTFAQYKLGDFFEHGRGVAVDVNKGCQWHLRAADGGIDAAQAAVGWCYKNGTGVPKDNLETYKWWALAKEAGIPFIDVVLLALKAELKPAEIKAAEDRVAEWKRKRNK